MNDLISVSSLLKNSAQIEFANTDGTVGMYINVKAVKLEQQYNSIDAESVVHGHWIKTKSKSSVDFTCSACGYTFTDGDPEYECDYLGCPMCRAKMDEVSE